MAYIKKIKLPNSDQVYDIYDAGAARKEDVKQLVAGKNIDFEEKDNQIVINTQDSLTDGSEINGGTW